MKESKSSPTFAFVPTEEAVIFTHKQKGCLVRPDNRKKTEFVCVESDSPNEFMIKILSIVVCNIFFSFLFFSHRLVPLHAHSYKIYMQKFKMKREILVYTFSLQDFVNLYFCGRTHIILGYSRFSHYT